MTNEQYEIEALRGYYKELKTRVEYLESLNAEPDTIDDIVKDYRKHGYINGEPCYSWTVELTSRQHKTVTSLQAIASCDHRGIVTVSLQEAERHGLKVWPYEKELKELNKWLKGIVGDCD